MSDPSLGDMLQAIRDDQVKAKNLLSLIDTTKSNIAHDEACIEAAEHKLIIELVKKKRFSCLKVDYTTLRKQERGEE